MNGLTSFGRLISDPTRLKIIKLLLTKTMCVCELIEVLKVNQPCISQHLSILKYHHLLKSQRDGKWIEYEIDSQAFQRYLSEVDDFIKQPLIKIPVLKRESRRLAALKNRRILCKKCK